MKNIKKIYGPKNNKGERMSMSLIHRDIQSEYIDADDELLVRNFMLDTTSDKDTKELIKRSTHRQRIDILKKTGFEIIEELNFD